MGGLIASFISKWLTKKSYVGVNKLRKGFTFVGALGFSFCMLGIFLAECNIVINILCFTLSLFSSGVALAGIMIAGVDMTPMFAGTLMGVASTIGGLSTVIIPLLTGYLTTHVSKE
ncbi:inorganic phosphate cotransporter [Nephila pilipes]|uniref:Inorganic phosphate cotransporter n=1 Tax=Nephila pilipes TaxID=299642 RepID=A0A8X6U5D9_NEPPI|nr:inorganic phosphate cotransporter [Nephila pilipes]